jgi:hypothetical protein
MLANHAGAVGEASKDEDKSSKAYRDREWSLVMSMTHQMKTAAEAGEWTELVELEPKRRALLEDFFSQPVSPEDVLKIQEDISTILALDKTITEASQVKRDDLSTELAGLNRNRQAQKAYASNR